VHLASYPQRDVKCELVYTVWVKAYAADWVTGMSASCTAGPVVH